MSKAMIRNYLKIALRNILKSKIYSIINIAGLAVGIAVAVLIGLWVIDELSFNKRFKNYDRLAQLMLHQTFNAERTTDKVVAIPVVNEIKQKYGPYLKQSTLVSHKKKHIIQLAENKFSEPGLYVENAFSEMFSLHFLKGDQNAVKEPGTIALANSLAQSLFGNENPMGKTLRLDTKYDLKITGVFEDMPTSSDFKDVVFLLPWSDYSKHEPWVKNAEQDWGDQSFEYFVRLGDHVNLQNLSQQINSIDTNNADMKEYQPEYFLHPMNRWHLYSDFKNGVNVGGNIRFVWMFSIIGIFVLLLACINFMNLSTARSEKRAKEVGVRKSVGSLNSQLVNQFLFESLLVVFIAMILGFALAGLVLPAFNQLSEKALKVPVGNPIFWGVAIAFMLITGLLAGSYPAFYLSSFNPLSTLKGTFKVGKWASVPRKVMVVVQFTVSITLIIGTIIVFQQIKYAKERPVGYDREGIIQIEMQPGHYGKYDVLRRDLLESGMVVEMSESSSEVTDIRSTQSSFEWEGRSKGAVPIFGAIACTHDFGKTIGWEIVEGRDFSRDFSMDTSAIIVNESAAKLIGSKNIVGKTIKRFNKPKVVVGVVKDMVMDSPYKPTVPTIFILDYEWANLINIKLNPGAPVREAVQTITNVFKKHDPNTPFDFKFADETYEVKFKAEVLIGNLARMFATLAVFISCLGLFGLAAYTAEQRTKEIGIRKVLGASIVQMWAMLSQEFVLLVLLSSLIACPIALFLLKDWLSQYDYKVEMTWIIFVGPILGAVVVTLLTVSYQAIRAASLDPVKSLKNE